MENLKSDLTSDPRKIPPFHYPDAESAIDEGGAQYHDAAYDAYSTGVCYAALSAKHFEHETRAKLKEKGIFCDDQGRPVVLPGDMENVSNKVKRILSENQLLAADLNKKFHSDLHLPQIPRPHCVGLGPRSDRGRL